MDIFSEGLTQAIASAFDVDPPCSLRIDGVHPWVTSDIVLFHVKKDLVNEREGKPGRPKWSETIYYGIARVNYGKIEFLYLDKGLQPMRPASAFVGPL